MSDDTTKDNQNTSDPEVKTFTQDDVNKIVSERVNKLNEEKNKLSEQLKPFLEAQKEAELKAEKEKAAKLELLNGLSADEVKKILASRNAPSTTQVVQSSEPKKTYRFIDTSNIKIK